MKKTDGMQNALSNLLDNEADTEPSDNVDAGYHYEAQPISRIDENTKSITQVMEELEAEVDGRPYIPPAPYLSELTAYKRENKSKRINLLIKPSDYKKITKLSKETHLSVNELINQAITLLLNREERAKNGY